MKNPKAKVFMLQLPFNPPQDLTKRFPEATPEALDLLRSMLQLDYQKRITVDQALEHPYFASVRDIAMEFTSQSAVAWGEIETCELTGPNLQMRILEDIIAFHPHCETFLDEHRSQLALRKATAASPSVPAPRAAGEAGTSMMT